MASSDVEFYQRQKDLQDTVTKCEQERLQLEKQLKLQMQSDQNSAQMKATRLHTYWKKLCADEKRAQQRNAMLVREFERIDSHLSSMTARTEHLNLLKQQYADYVARTYPLWTQMVEQKMRGETEPSPARQDSAREMSNLRHSQDWAEAEKEDSLSHQQQQQHHQQKQQPQAGRTSRESSVTEDSASAKMPMSQPIQSVSVKRLSSPDRKPVSSPAIVPTSAVPTSSVANVSAIRATRPQQQQQQHFPQHQQQQHSPPKQPAAATQKVSDVGGDAAKTEYVNISSFSNQQAAPAHIGQGDLGAMDPGKDNEDEVSDFESDLPLSAGDASPVKEPVDRPLSRREQFSQSRADSVRSVRSSGSLLPELTVDGLICLLRHIEADLRTKKPGVEYYCSPILNPEEKMDIIQRANANVALKGVSGQTASNVVLEQMSHVVRSLPEGCLIAEELLTKPHKHLTSHAIEHNLAGDAQDLWTVIFQHFTCLLAAGVMEPREIAAVFVPCLVVDRSQFQDKAFSLVVSLLERDDADAATDASSIASPQPPASPQALGGSGSIMEDGKVPPLKFGSLVDKPLSDDEVSSFFDQSLPKEPAMPLNETSAYKQMLSGTIGSQQKASVMSDDTDEDDVEKVLASSLTPKGSGSQQALGPAATPREAATDPESMSEVSSPGPKFPVYVPTAMEQKPKLGSTGGSQAQRRPGLKLGSDFETDSEIDTGILGSSKRPIVEVDDFDFYD